MKKLFLLCVCFCVVFVSGCVEIREIENNRVVTACVATKNGNELTYSFYVSVPSGGEGGEDTGSKSSAKIYDYKSVSFSDALDNFEMSGAYKSDFTHISIFIANEAYYNENFKYDEKYIRKHISATSLMYANVYNGEKGDLFDCIKNEYNSKPEEFAEYVFSGNNSALSCKMSELSLAINNKYYTAVIPVIEINKRGKHKLPEINCMSVFSDNKNPEYMNDSDFKVYSNWRKKHKNMSDGYSIKKEGEKVVALLSDKSLCETAAKFADKETDILNIIYYSKNCFLTFENYKKFADKYSISDIKFKVDSK